MANKEAMAIPEETWVVFIFWVNYIPILTSHLKLLRQEVFHVHTLAKSIRIQKNCS
jgi:hypothetical protein